jgi:hypothetical protein
MARNTAGEDTHLLTKTFIRGSLQMAIDLGGESMRGLMVVFTRESGSETK